MSPLLPLISIFPAKVANSFVITKLSAKKVKTIRLARKKALPLHYQIIVELKNSGMNNIESSTGEIVMYQPDETIRLEVRMGEIR